MGILTAIDFLVNRGRLDALVPLLDGLTPQSVTLEPVAVLVHSPLQEVPLPPKHVVAVRTIARSIAIAPNKRLRPVRWPVGLVVEGRRVPYDLVEELRNLDGMRRGTGTATLESAARICDMAVVVGAVEVDAVPAPTHIQYQERHEREPHLRREPDVRHDSGRTRVSWHGFGSAGAGHGVL